MKNILHFHPNAFYAKKFVAPLIYSEKKFGFSSNLVAETTNAQSDHIIKFSITMNPVRLILNFSKLIIFLKKNKPDIIFVHNSTSALLPLLASRLVLVKNIIYFNHGLPFLGYSGFLRYSLKNLERINCILANNIVTVSNEMKKKLSKLTKKTVFVIHNGSASGLDLKNETQNTNSINKIKKRINFKTNDIIILYVGRPNKRKGFFDLLEIWDKNFKNKRNLKLILLGVNDEDFIIKNKKIPKNIFPMGLVIEPSYFFELADYLFMTSYHEGLSYSVLEAFMFRTIVISNKIDGVDELVKHKYNGFVIEKNKDEYLKYLNYCEINQKLKKKMLDRSLKLISKYSRQSFLKHYIKFIEKLKL